MRGDSPLVAGRGNLTREFHDRGMVLQHARGIREGGAALWPTRADASGISLVEAEGTL